MRGLLVAAITVLGMGFFCQGAARADDDWNWRRGHWYAHPRPTGPLSFGSNGFNTFQYRTPHLQSWYYTPPRYAPDGPPAFGYVPFNSYNYRPTPRFNFYNYDILVP